MAKLEYVVGAGLHPDDLWRNYVYLEQRIRQLEAKVHALTKRLMALETAQPTVID